MYSVLWGMWEIFSISNHSWSLIFNRTLTYLNRLFGIRWLHFNMNTNPKLIEYQSFKYKCDKDCSPLCSNNIQFNKTLTSPVLKTKPSGSYIVLFTTYKNTASHIKITFLISTMKASNYLQMWYFFDNGCLKLQRNASHATYSD